MNTAQQRLADDQEFLASLTDRPCFSSPFPAHSLPACPQLCFSTSRALFVVCPSAVVPTRRDFSRLFCVSFGDLLANKIEQVRSREVREEEGGVREAQHAPLPGGGGDR